VDVNSTSADELDRIKHICPVRAEEMLTLRPFSSLDDLERINGIGPSRLADIKSEGLACIGN
jgi:competence protein ComEC